VTIVSPGLRARQEVTYGGNAEVLKCWPDVDGVTQGTLTTPTVDIYTPSAGRDATPLVTNGSCTEDGTTHELSYTLNASTTSTWVLDAGYVAVFSWVKSSITHTVRKLFDVVLVPLAHYPPLRIDDLKGIHKSVDQALTQLSITDGAARFILPAWEEILEWVRTQGFRPALITEPEALKTMLRAKAAQKLCTALATAGNDLMDRYAAQFRDDYEEARGNVRLEYSESESYGGEGRVGWQQPRLAIGPEITRGTSRVAVKLSSQPVRWR
jgi:hypothetical protein